MHFYWLTLGVLAVWRITHLLQAEDGPWDIGVRLRRSVGQGFWGKLLDCFECLSLWTAAPTACFLGSNWTERLFMWLGFSAGAILLERTTKREAGVTPALYYEDNQEKENEHVMLRKSENSIPNEPPKPPAV